ncbi:MAG: aminoglycoside N(3)-acetyltransferase [Nitrospinota bacterium]|nr:MAG: aminoglycoside N(3)-acetyltransferase [Nitrospinota bacterium]
MPPVSPIAMYGVPSRSKVLLRHAGRSRAPSRFRGGTSPMPTRTGPLSSSSMHTCWRRVCEGREMTNRILRYLQRHGTRQLSKVFFRVDRRLLVTSLQRLGLERGAVVCVHASLSRLGHVVGGADAVIDALMETVGTTGCLLMPSFPMTGSIVRYLEEGEPFDVRHSPSRVGLVTEVFRQREGVLRSLHPTNAMAAWGQGAWELLRDHEKSPTPYGAHTPYGRLAEQEESFILMLETHVHSLLHHLQERVDFPNLFLPEEREAPFIDEAGLRRTMRTRVLRPRIPYFVAIPSSGKTEPDWAILHDFALIFPRRRERLLRQRGYRFAGYPRLYQRRAVLEERGILRTTRVGRGEIGLLHVRGFLNHIEPELRDLIERFRSCYDPERIAALRLPYF